MVFWDDGGVGRGPARGCAATCPSAVVRFRARHVSGGDGGMAMARASIQLERDLDWLRSPGFARRCAVDRRWFTRDRKLPCDRLVTMILCRKGLSMKLDIREFARQTGVGAVSASAVSQARMKLAPEAFASLAARHAEGLYTMGDADSGIRLFRGRVVLGVDGTSVIVPTNPATLAEFGTNSPKGGRPTAEAGISCMYDLLNDYVVDLSVHRFKFNERRAAVAHLDALRLLSGRPAVVVMDRGYAGMPLMLALMGAGAGFVIRLPSATFRAERATLDGPDGWADVRCDTPARLHAWKGRPEHGLLREAGSMRLRFTDVGAGPDGTSATVCSNLPDGEFDAAAIAALYALRWKEETAFRVLKGNLQLGNFTGTRPRLILQDIHAAAYLADLAADLVADAAEAGLPARPYPVAVNRAHAIGVMKQELARVLTEPDPDERVRLMRAMNDEIRAEVCPIRPGRHYPRNRNLRSGKHHNTHKRSY